MDKELKTTYFRLLAPAVLAIVTIFVFQRAGFLVGAGAHLSAWLGPALFILAGTFAIALPIFYRTLFLHRIRHQRRTPTAALLAFERRFLLLAMVPVYLAAIAYALEITYFHFVGTVLMALYAAYYYYPSTQRIDSEKRLFRAEPE
jgi:membrane protease YdiL (CAAX protease family)